jgi:hypothetical protein
MSSITWTPVEVRSSALFYHATVWSFVESQYRLATINLVDSLSEQALLEALLEDSQPSLLDSLEGLHPRLATPFRYRPRSPSRFRSPHQPGVFYAAENQKSAAAEMAYHRWRFLHDALDLEHLDPTNFIAFSLPLETLAADLTNDPLVRDSFIWTNKNDYSQTQEFADITRMAAIPAIVYESVRDPERGRCIAVLDPVAFAKREPEPKLENWILTITPTRAIWVNLDSSIEFPTGVWA